MYSDMAIICVQHSFRIFFKCALQIFNKKKIRAGLG